MRPVRGWVDPTRRGLIRCRLEQGGDGDGAAADGGTQARGGRSLDQIAGLIDWTSIRYTERLAEASIEPSVGSVGDSYDNALAESINGLYKTEVIRRRGPWRSLETVEFATLEWVEWLNQPSATRADRKRASRRSRSDILRRA